MLSRFAGLRLRAWSRWSILCAPTYGRLVGLCWKVPAPAYGIVFNATRLYLAAFLYSVILNCFHSRVNARRTTVCQYRHGGALPTDMNHKNFRFCWSIAAMRFGFAVELRRESCVELVRNIERVYKTWCSYPGSQEMFSLDSFPSKLLAASKRWKMPCKPDQKAGFMS